MRVKSKPPLTLTAGDLMNPDVVRPTEKMALRDAAHPLHGVPTGRREDRARSRAVKLLGDSALLG
jgi:hypothetical protein